MMMVLISQLSQSVYASLFFSFVTFVPCLELSYRTQISSCPGSLFTLLVSSASTLSACQSSQPMTGRASYLSVWGLASTFAGCASRVLSRLFRTIKRKMTGKDQIPVLKIELVRHTLLVSFVYVVLGNIPGIFNNFIQGISTGFSERFRNHIFYYAYGKYWAVTYLPHR